jgi:acyl carrier protein
MEQDYGISVSDEDAENIHTVGEAIDFANQRLTEA